MKMVSYEVQAFWGGQWVSIRFRESLKRAKADLNHPTDRIVRVVKTETRKVLKRGKKKP